MGIRGRGATPNCFGEPKTFGFYCARVGGGGRNELRPYKKFVKYAG